jgi:hypothetical protein
VFSLPGDLLSTARSDLTDFALTPARLDEPTGMDPLEKAVMDSFIAAATRNESGCECVRAAVETWIALNPGADFRRAAQEVNETLARLRLIEDHHGAGCASDDERQRVVDVWRRAEAIGLHPDNCLARAVDAWLKEHPADDRPTAEKRVSRIIDLERTAP